MGTAVVFVCAGAPAAGAAVWTAPFEVPGSALGSASAVLRDGLGDSTMAWQVADADAGVSGAIAVSSRGREGSFSTRVVSAGEAPPDGPPVLAGDAAGLQAVAWVTEGAGIDFVAGRVGELGDRRSVPAGVVGGSAGAVDVGVASDGRLVFAWTVLDNDDNGQVRAVVRDVDGSFGGPVALSEPNADASAPRVATSADGASVVAFVDDAETPMGRAMTQTTTRLRVSRRSGAAFGPADVVAIATLNSRTIDDGDGTTITISNGEDLEEPEVAADAVGGFVLAFRRVTVSSDPSDGEQTRTSVAQAATRPPGAGLGVTGTVSPVGQNVDQLSLAVGDRGAGVLAWTVISADPFGDPSIQAVRRAGGGQFGGAQQVAGPAQAPAAAVRADGAPIVVFVTAMRVAAVVGTGDGYEPMVVLGAQDPPSSELAVAADDAGGALASWTVQPADGEPSIWAAELRPDRAVQPPPAVPPEPGAVQPPPPVAPGPGSVEPPPVVVSGPGNATPSVDRTAPRITAVRMTPPVFTVASGSSRIQAARLARGSSLQFTLSESAFVQITISRLKVTRVRRTRCERRSSRWRDRRVERVGLLRTNYSRGAQREQITGRIGRRALSPGRYVARLRAADRDGNLSSIRSVRFTVC